MVLMIRNSIMLGQGVNIEANLNRQAVHVDRVTIHLLQNRHVRRSGDFGRK